jgi:hypothetical protein
MRSGEEWSWLRKAEVWDGPRVAAVSAESPGEVLKQARAAFACEDWPLALDRYEYFFDHALDDDPARYYGVRLSYCLSEWARLGERYEPAGKRLEARAEQSLAEFDRTSKRERFHDFVAISRALGRDDEGVRSFLGYHTGDIRLARKVGQFVWHRLVELELWDVCSEHLRKPGKRVDLAFVAFDIESDAGREMNLNEFSEKGSERRLIRTLNEVAIVLNRSGRKRDLEIIRLRIVKQLERRDLIDFQSRISDP